MGHPRPTPEPTPPGLNSRRATLRDAAYFSTRLRAADLQELEHSSGSDPLTALLRSVRLSTQSWVAEWEGEPVCLFGVMEDAFDEERGIIWLVGTDDVERLQRPFLRTARRWFDGLSSRYGELANAVWSGNALHLRWLKWMGAELGEPVPHPHSQALFVPFRYV